MFLNIGTDTDTNICESPVKTSGKLTSLLCFCPWATDAACWSWTARLLSSLLYTESAWWCGSFEPPLSGPHSLPETDSRRGASWGNKADPITPKYPTRATQTEIVTDCCTVGRVPGSAKCSPWFWLSAASAYPAANLRQTQMITDRNKDEAKLPLKKIWIEHNYRKKFCFFILDAKSKYFCKFLG